MTSKGSHKMKIAVTAKAPNLDAEMDPRFGRAAHILIVDTETMDVEALDNSENINAFRGAGIQAAGMVCEKGIEVLLTGYCGPKAFAVLEAAGVKVANDFTGTVRDAVEAFKSGKVTYADQPNADGHW